MPIDIFRVSVFLNYYMNKRYVRGVVYSQSLLSRPVLARKYSIHRTRWSATEL